MRPTFSLLFCAVLATAVARPALAGQEAATPSGTPAPDSLTRAALLAAAREQKALEPKPVERSTVEKGLYWYDNQYLLSRVFGNWKGFHIGGANFPAGAGTKFGVAYDHVLGSEENLERSNRFDVGCAPRSEWRASSGRDRSCGTASRSPRPPGPPDSGRSRTARGRSGAIRPQRSELDR